MKTISISRWNISGLQAEIFYSRALKLWNCIALLLNTGNLYTRTDIRNGQSDFHSMYILTDLQGK